MNVDRREIELTAMVELASGRTGQVIGITRTAPDPLFDIQLPSGEVLRNVPEAQLVAVIAPPRPDLVRAQPVRSRPFVGIPLQYGAEVRRNPLMAPVGVLRLRGGR
jgi:hypothetical protein